MKFFRPDTNATQKWESSIIKDEKGKPFSAEVKESFTLEQSNAVLMYANSENVSPFEGNRYVVSCLLTKFVTKVEDENGEIEEIPREKTNTNGVRLIDSEFLEMFPPALFLELADHCTQVALKQLEGEEQKN